MARYIILPEGDIVLRDVQFLRVIKRRIEWLAGTLIYIESCQTRALKSEWAVMPKEYFQAWQYCEALFKDCRYAAYGYRQCWILRHMIRMIFAHVFGIDLFEYQAFTLLSVIRGDERSV